MFPYHLTPHWSSLFGPVILAKEKCNKYLIFFNVLPLLFSQRRRTAFFRRNDRKNRRPETQRMEVWALPAGLISNCRVVRVLLANFKVIRQHNIIITIIYCYNCSGSLRSGHFVIALMNARLARQWPVAVVASKSYSKHTTYLSSRPDRPIRQQ